MESVDLKKLASPREMILTVVILMALVGVFFKMIYSPRSKVLGDLKTKQTSVEKDLKVLEDETKLLAMQKEQRQAQKKVSPNIKLQILNGDLKTELADLSDLINTITEKSPGLGVEIESLSGKTPIEGKGYSKTPLEIKTRGSFESNIKFLDQIADLKALVSIDSVEFATDADEKGIVNLTAKTTLFQLEEYK